VVSSLSGEYIILYLFGAYFIREFLQVFFLMLMLIFGFITFFLGACPILRNKNTKSQPTVPPPGHPHGLSGVNCRYCK
jgi:hypothetical protein